MFSKSGVKSKLKNLCRHYGLVGDQIVGMWDTAAIAYGNDSVRYITVAVKTEAWKLIRSGANPPELTTHPVLRGKFLKLLTNVYVMQATPSIMEKIEWSDILNTYVLTKEASLANCNAAIEGAHSSKRLIEYTTTIKKVIKDDQVYL